MDLTARAGTPARAVVCAGGQETEYLRAGRGMPILLVVGDVDTPDVQRLIGDLSTHALVLAAAPDARNGQSFGAWKNAFVEGLGLADVHVLLHASLAGPILNGESNDE